MGLNKEVVKSSKDLADNIASLMEFNQQDVTDEEPFSLSFSFTERLSISGELIGIQHVNFIPNNKNDLLKTGSRKLETSLGGRSPIWELTLTSIFDCSLNM